MNRLAPPNYVEDNVALDLLAANKLLKCNPLLSENVTNLKNGYKEYIAANGNPTIVQDVPLPNKLQEHLRKLYASPPIAIQYINQLREESDANCCPMCGSFHSGTLDHFLPKSDYPAYAIFSRNLVPACKCNSTRTNLLVGPDVGERILHPYFDDVLHQRLFAARFSDLGLTPDISLRPLLNEKDPHYPALCFHMKNIVERTAILRHVKSSWLKLIRRPSLAAAEFRDAPASHQKILDILSNERERQDEIYESKNNWNSVFISGLLDQHVLDWLASAFFRPGYTSNAPLLEHVV